MESALKEPIPSHWAMKPLGSALLHPPSYGINAAAAPYSPDAPTYIRITDINDDGRFEPNPKVSVRAPLARTFLLAEGDLVFARTGATVGKSYRYRPGDGELVFAGFLIRVTPDPTVLDPRYLAYYAQTQVYWDWVTTTSARSGQPGINGMEYRQLPLLLPPVAEQHAIVGVLSGIDAEIEGIKRVIAKKRAVSQGVMQQLLTGRTRLSGFQVPWDRRSVGALGTLLKGRGIKRDEVRPHGVPCIRYGEIYTRYSNYVAKPLSHVDPATALKALPITQGDLLFVASGETSDEIGLCVAYTGEGPAVAGGDIVVLRLRERHDPVFLGCWLNASTAQQQKARLGQGDAVVHISASALGSLEVEVPRHEEQQAIAEIVLDMDAELAVLEVRLSKARAIKQGMMQELLTGRTRLVSREEPADRTPETFAEAVA